MGEPVLLLDQDRGRCDQLLIRRGLAALERAVALGMAFGPAAGLRLVDEPASEPSLRAFFLLPSVRGDLLAKLGRLDEARAEFERAASLAQNAASAASSSTARPPAWRDRRARRDAAPVRMGA